MKHVLCAVDLTHLEDARTLLTEARKIAEPQRAQFSIVTVLPDYGSSFVGSFFKDGTLKEAAGAAQVALHSLAEEVMPGIQVQCIVEIGTVYAEVLEAAQKCDADFIIVGAHKPDPSDRIIGPNAARIARHATASVLIARFDSV